MNISREYLIQLEQALSELLLDMLTSAHRKTKYSQHISSMNKALYVDTARSKGNVYLAIKEKEE